MTVRRPTVSFAVCVTDDSSEDLEQRRLYQALPDRAAAQEGYIRIVDESGEDYLYPSDLSVAVRLPPGVAKRLMSSSRQQPVTPSRYGSSLTKRPLKP